MCKISYQEIEKEKRILISWRPQVEEAATILMAEGKRKIFVIIKIQKLSEVSHWAGYQTSDERKEDANLVLVAMMGTNEADFTIIVKQQSGFFYVRGTY